MKKRNAFIQRTRIIILYMMENVQCEVQCETRNLRKRKRKHAFQKNICIIENFKCNNLLVLSSKAHTTLKND